MCMEIPICARETFWNNTLHRTCMGTLNGTPTLNLKTEDMEIKS